MEINIDCTDRVLGFVIISAPRFSIPRRKRLLSVGCKTYLEWPDPEFTAVHLWPDLDLLQRLQFSACPILLEKKRPQNSRIDPKANGKW
ncbi:hypothetical protein Tco_0122304 [Tanacetum coccineum]